MEERMTRISRIFGLLAAGLLAWSAEPTVPDAAQERRVRHLEESLLAPCCWAETVAVHRSEIALQMRQEIAHFVQAGKSDREILDHYKSLHGTRILIEPEGTARLWVYFIPVAAAAAGLALVVFVIRRLSHGNPADQPT
jgi:cytochrome c-type biogenesis protein CcmH